jgi:acetylornithine/succinyldiaminopimelate/putrescine aminotransferase
VSENSRLFEKLVSVECPDSTYHPASNPLVFKSARGSVICDADGQSYIDLCAGFGVMALGHPTEDQLAELIEGTSIIHGMGDVYASVDKIEFIHELAALYPHGPARVALALTGAQAVEIALKTAMLATKGSGFICFEGSYHGVELGVLPVTHRQDFRAPFKSWLRDESVEFVPFGCTTATLERAQRALQMRGFKLAGLIVEPIQGRAGIIVPPRDWLIDVAAWSKTAGCVSILDDIFAGLGRTGVMTNAQNANFDLVCLGKALGGGFPISACLGRSSVMEAWPVCNSEALHTGTFFGHPLSCRSGLKALKAIRFSNLPQRALELGQKIKEFINVQLAGSSRFVEIRGEGLMIGIAYSEVGFGAKLMDQLRSHGVLALASGPRGDSLSITPALNIPENLLFDALQKIVDLSK